MLNVAEPTKLVLLDWDWDAVILDASVTTLEVGATPEEEGRTDWEAVATCDDESVATAVAADELWLLVVEPAAALEVGRALVGTP